MMIPVPLEPILDKVLARIAELDLALRLACEELRRQGVYYGETTEEDVVYFVKLARQAVQP